MPTVANQPVFVLMFAKCRKVASAAPVRACRLPTAREKPPRVIRILIVSHGRQVVYTLGGQSAKARCSDNGSGIARSHPVESR